MHLCNYIFCDLVIFQMYRGRAQRYCLAWREPLSHPGESCWPPIPFGALLLQPQSAQDHRQTEQDSRGFSTPVHQGAPGRRQEAQAGISQPSFPRHSERLDLAGITQWVLRCAQSLAAWQLPLLSRSNLGIYRNEQNTERETPVHYRGTRHPQPHRSCSERGCRGKCSDRMCIV